MVQTNFWMTEKLSSIVRTVAEKNEAREQHVRSTQNTPQPSWENQIGRDRPKSRESNHRHTQRDGRDSQTQKEMKDSQRERIERYGSMSSHREHARNGSGTTTATSTADFGEAQANNGTRRHDYDVQSMETDLSSSRVSMARNPIPPPAVTVRSEYPTLNRSRQSQTLTCLITIEVLQGKWSPDPEDLRNAPQMILVQSEKEVVPPSSPESSRRGDWAAESPETLEEVTEDLRLRVDNWHGLDFSRYLLEFTRAASASNFLVDSENCGCMGQYEWAKTANHGKNLNVSSSPRCSYVSKKRKGLHHNMLTATPIAN